MTTARSINLPRSKISASLRSSLDDTPIDDHQLPFSWDLFLSPRDLYDNIQQKLQHRWKEAENLAYLEQKVADYNWISQQQSNSHKKKALFHRRLLVLPLDEDRFDPPVGQFSHGHVETSDGIIVPSHFLQVIQDHDVQVPYLFRVSRIPEGDTTPERLYQYKSQVQHVENEEKRGRSPFPQSPKPQSLLDSVIGSSMNFRAPANYVFLPVWMIRSLGVRPFDIVVVELTETIPAGSAVTFRPHGSDFSTDIQDHPQAILETKLRHYASLTTGSTISVDYAGKRYHLDVEKVRSGRGTGVPAVRVQDCNVASEFLPSRESVYERKQNLEELRKKRMGDSECEEL